MKGHWIVGALVLMLPVAANAQRYERPEWRHGSSERRDDMRDERRLERLLEEFDQARRARSAQALARVDDQLHRLLDDELREGRREAWESRRRAYNDRRDAWVERRMYDRLKTIQADLLSIRGSWSYRALAQKRGIILELIDFARAEQRQNESDGRGDHHRFGRGNHGPGGHASGPVR